MPRMGRLNEFIRPISSSCYLGSFCSPFALLLSLFVLVLLCFWSWEAFDKDGGLFTRTPWYKDTYGSPDPNQWVGQAMAPPLPDRHLRGRTVYGLLYFSLSSTVGNRDMLRYILPHNFAPWVRWMCTPTYWYVCICTDALVHLLKAYRARRRVRWTICRLRLDTLWYFVSTLRNTGFDPDAQFFLTYSLDLLASWFLPRSKHGSCSCLYPSPYSLRL